MTSNTTEPSKVPSAAPAQPIASSGDAVALLMGHALATGQDLAGTMRLSITYRGGASMTVDTPLQSCLELMAGLTTAMAHPPGRRVFMDPRHQIVIDAAEVLAMVIRPVPA